MENNFARRVRIPAFISLAGLLLAVCCGCTKLGKNQGVSDEGSQRAPAFAQLSQDDVSLYLELMRAAAARVKNLSPADEATLAKMNKLQDDIEAGRIPTPQQGDPAAEVIEQGMKLQYAMDEVIAEEKEIDVARYTALRDLIERTVNPSDTIPDDGQAGLGRPMTPAESQILLANKKILAPLFPEIEQLYQVVRLSLAAKPK